MPGRRWLREIERLDPIADHKRIVYIDGVHEFPWDIQRALELALFRTFAVPSIGGLLAGTGEFFKRPQKRYDDTDLLISLLLEEGYDTGRGARALERMNAIHGRFKISNDDYLYVLSTFVLEPIRWIDRYGWRRSVPAERLAMHEFWRNIGGRMGIRDIPASLEAMDAFNRQFEADNFQANDNSRRVGEATRDFLLTWFPRPLRGAVTRGIYAALDPDVADAFDFPRATSLERAVLQGALRLRARVHRWLPGRGAPRLRTEPGPRPSYKDGWRLDLLGPPSFVAAQARDSQTEGEQEPS